MAEKEYIERKTLLDRIRGTGYAEQVKGNLLAMAVTIPAVDVRPVVRGKWEDETGFIFSDLSQQVRCSKCGLIAYFYDKMPMNFCPNCGADMREES